MHVNYIYRDGQTIISTELQDIRTGDYVSIAQVDNASIRRLQLSLKHHQAVADNYQFAKNELTKAETDDAITNTAK